MMNTLYLVVLYIYAGLTVDPEEVILGGFSTKGKAVGFQHTEEVKEAFRTFKHKGDLWVGIKPIPNEPQGGSILHDLITVDRYVLDIESTSYFSLEKEVVIPSDKVLKPIIIEDDFIIYVPSSSNSEEQALHLLEKYNDSLKKKDNVTSISTQQQKAS
jgi:hypothetical protein